MPILLTTLVASLVSVAGTAQPTSTPDPRGFEQPADERSIPQAESDRWWGEVSLPNGRMLAFVVSVAEDGSATMSIPAQGLADQPLHDVEFTRESARFTLRVGPTAQTWALFELEQIEGGAAGTMTQSGAAMRVRMAQGDLGEGELPSLEAIDRAQDAQAWAGATQFAGGDLAFAVTFRQKSDGSWAAALDIPAQNVFGTPLVDVEYGETEIRFTLKNPGPAANSAVWELTRDADGATASGICNQIGGEWPTTIRLAESVDAAKETVVEASKPDRPQTPEGPFEYRVEEITLDGAADQIIAGTLTLPDPAKFGEGPYAGVVLISGSGQQDRDSTIADHKPFAVIADHLTSRGIAVLRYDDRGVGGSDGNPATSDTVDFAKDASLVAAYLAGDERVDAKRVGLVGHSEGGLIAPMVAAESDDVSFIALLAPMGLPGGEVIVTQGRAMALAAGADPVAVERASEIRQEMVDAINDEADADTLREILRRLIVEESGGRLPDEQVEQRVEGSLAAVMSPWYSKLVRIDPATYLKNVSVPVLAMQGETDTQVLADLNLDAIATALEAGENPPLTIKRYPGLNHLFQQSPSGALDQYARLTETFNEQTLEDLGDWLVEITQTPAARVEPRMPSTAD